MGELSAFRSLLTEMKQLWSLKTLWFVSLLTRALFSTDQCWTLLQEAGKLLLRPEPIEFGGNKLNIMEESLSKPIGPTTATRGNFVPRSAVSRPRAGIGSKKGRGGASFPSTSTRSAPGPSVSSTGKGQDDFRKMLGGS